MSRLFRRMLDRVVLHAAKQSHCTVLNGDAEGTSLGPAIPLNLGVNLLPNLRIRLMNRRQHKPVPHLDRSSARAAAPSAYFVWGHYRADERSSTSANRRIVHYESTTRRGIAGGITPLDHCDRAAKWERRQDSIQEFKSGRGTLHNLDLDVFGPAFPSN